MSDFDIEPRHKRALDELEWHEHMAEGDEDYAPDSSVHLIVRPDNGPGMRGGEPVIVVCENREEAEQILFGLARQSPEDQVDIALNVTTAKSVVEDWFQQADRQMGDPNP